MNEKAEWRPIQKFPGYEVSDTGLVRFISTKHILPKSRSREGDTVLMHRSGWNTEVFVSEIYYHAFPEKRAEMSAAA
jgi:hypothetical protein